MCVIQTHCVAGSFTDDGHEIVILTATISDQTLIRPPRLYEARFCDRNWKLRHHEHDQERPYQLAVGSPNVGGA